MSFIVKGIELPKDGTVMHLIVQSGGKTQYITMGNGEPIFCKATQAIQISNPHGRIIDINKITKKPIFGTTDTYYDVPTILESEE